MAVKNVVLLGSTGNLGPTLVNALKDKYTVTALTSKGSAKTPPSGVKVTTVDYSSHEDLVNAFKGQDAVVSAVGAQAIKDQIKYVDAAIEAGVKYFIPSEFGGDTSNEKTSKLAVFAGKVKTREYLQANEGKISWIVLSNGGFFDWGVKSGFLGLNKAEKKATLYDGGNVTISVTTLKSVGAAVAALLAKPEEFKNRHVYVNSAKITQRKLLDVAEKHTGGDKWTIVDASTAEIEKETNAQLASGNFAFIWKLILRSLYGEGHGGNFQNVSNEALGIEFLDDAAVAKVVTDSLDALPA